MMSYLDDFKDEYLKYIHNYISFLIKHTGRYLTFDQAIHLYNRYRGEIKGKNLWKLQHILCCKVNSEAITAKGRDIDPWNIKKDIMAVGWCYHYEKYMGKIYTPSSYQTGN